MGSEVNQNQQLQSSGKLLRQVDEQELKQILEHHKQWVDAHAAGEQTGGPADLSRTDLAGMNLSGAELRHVRLQAACLRGADLNGANLHEADLGAANLRNAKLQETDLRNANLKDAELPLSNQLARADLAGAQLPGAILKFEGLEIVEQISRNARTIMFSMLLACVYTWLTIATTTDPLLLTNSISSPLPIIGTEIPIAGFFWVAPLILLGLYFYFHIYLQRLWETLADLPAVFPDGTRLDKRAYPWLLNGLVNSQFKRLRDTRPRFSRLQTGLSVLLAWWTVPVTLLVLWGRYLPRHDWLGTTLLSGLSIAAIGSGILFYRAAMATLRREVAPPLSWRQYIKNKTGLKRAASVVGMSAVFFGFSFGAIHGIPYIPKLPAHSASLDARLWVPRLMEAVGNSPFADFVEENLSAKPQNWVEKKDDKSNLGLIKGARLKNANLTYARARSAFLVKADLREANLFGADLRGADLRQANLQNATLNYAQMGDTKLDGAILTGAEFQGVTLQGYRFEGNDLQGVDFQDALLQQINFGDANLQGANFNGARLVKVNLQEADLLNASFQDARLDEVSLVGANLRGAHLANVRGLTRPLLLKAANWVLARFDPGSLAVLELPADFSTRVQQKNLSGMNLAGVVFEKTDLQQFNFSGSNLQGARFRDVAMQQADFSHADLKKASIRGNLEGVNLAGADLREAQIRYSNLSGANLQGADFTNVQLVELDLSHANLANAKLAGVSFYNWVKIGNANLKGADFSDTSLVNTRGLTCKQIQEAVIDAQTRLPKHLGSCDQPGVN
jgi:uncharacterized protein YjbI with pentapeptide repeats